MVLDNRVRRAAGVEGSVYGAHNHKQQKQQIKPLSP